MEITADTLANLVIHYDMETCRRCGGEGRLWQHSNVEGGTCFRCHGRKRTHTAAASKAWQAFQAAEAELMAAPVEDIKAGDSVQGLHGTWRKVESVDRWVGSTSIWKGDPAGAWRMNGNTGIVVTELPTGEVQVAYPDQIEVKYVSTERQRRCGDGSLVYTAGIGFRVARFDREARAEAVRRIAGMRGVTVAVKDSAN